MPLSTCSSAVVLAGTLASPPAPLGLPPLEAPFESAFPGQYAPRPEPNFAPAPKRCMEIADTALRCPCLSWLEQDFATVRRHAPANARLAPPMPGERRVVFFGDSITDNWSRPTFGGFFPGKPYVNRGIGSQGTMQMLVRFRADVIALRPRVVVILAGTNDISGNAGVTPPEITGRNLGAMVALAHVHGIRVVLASLLPVRDGMVALDGKILTRTTERPLARIAGLNRWIAAFGRENGVVPLDYHAAVVGPDGQLRAELTDDGVHPNAAGYAAMAPAAERAISQAMRRPLEATRPTVLPPAMSDGLPAPTNASLGIPAPEPGCRALAERLLSWAALDRHATANAAVTAPSRNERRAVHFGDELAQGLVGPRGDAVLIERTVTGQTSEQLLARFPHDVLALRPSTVVIAAGRHDLAMATSRRTADQIADNVLTMGELARAHGIRPVIMNVPPVHDAARDPRTGLPIIHTGTYTPSAIETLNRRLAMVARRLRATLVDAHAVLRNPAGHLRSDYSDDGLSLTLAGKTALAAALPTGR